MRRWLVVLALLFLLPAPAEAQPRPVNTPPSISVAMYPYGSANTPPLNIACYSGENADNDNMTPPQNLVVERPFQFRIEPRFIGGRDSRGKNVGSNGQDVILTEKVYLDLFYDPSAPDPIDEARSSDSQWDRNAHLGAQTGTRELAQIGQQATFGHGPALHPVVGLVLKWDYIIEMQLGTQVAPKQSCEGEVIVWRAGDPRIPADAVYAPAGN